MAAKTYTVYVLVQHSGALSHAEFEDAVEERAVLSSAARDRVLAEDFEGVRTRSYPLAISLAEAYNYAGVAGLVPRIDGRFLEPQGSLGRVFVPRVRLPALQAAWSLENRTAAMSEGWDIFTADSSAHGSPQIQHLDEGAVLPDDSAAWELVCQKALSGSPLHRKALAIVEHDNREEYDRIVEGFPDLQRT